MTNKCIGADCDKVATLKCPICLSSGVDSYFCGKDCFKKNYAEHKKMHPEKEYDPFPGNVYTGSMRACYPLAAPRPIKEGIVKPDHADTSIPYGEQKMGRSTQIRIYDAETIEKMRTVSKLAREVLDLAGAAAKPGVTTEEIDRIVHEACMERDCYPSPKNYYGFPFSCCTSVNEAVCHQIPDKRKLQDGDILNVDVSIYKHGVHSDLNETYYIGDKAKSDPDTVRLVETTREALDKSIEAVKPGALVRNFGDVIEKHAKANKISVVRTYCGHGVGELFHTTPNVPHYGKNKAIGVCKPGMIFTIEPMLNLGTYRDKMWPDNWTSVTADGRYSAQFEHTLLVTEDGCEVLTARTASSPGGPVERC